MPALENRSSCTGNREQEHCIRTPQKANPVVRRSFIISGMSFFLKAHPL
jgi:hypothetical protein